MVGGGGGGGGGVGGGVDIGSSGFLNPIINRVIQ